MHARSRALVAASSVDGSLFDVCAVECVSALVGLLLWSAEPGNTEGANGSLITSEPPPALATELRRLSPCVQGKLARAMQRWQLVDDRSLPLLVHLAAGCGEPTLDLRFDIDSHLSTAALAQAAPHWRHVRSISVGACGVDDRFLALLAQSPAAATIERMDLKACWDVTLTGLRHLSAFPKLRVLVAPERLALKKVRRCAPQVKVVDTAEEFGAALTIEGEYQEVAVDLDGTPLPPAGWLSLHKLTLTNCLVSLPLLRSLGRIPALTRLELVEAVLVRDGGLAASMTAGRQQDESVDALEVSGYVEEEDMDLDNLEAYSIDVLRRYCVEEQVSVEGDLKADYIQAILRYNDDDDDDDEHEGEDDDLGELEVEYGAASGLVAEFCQALSSLDQVKELTLHRIAFVDSTHGPAFCLVAPPNLESFDFAVEAEGAGAVEFATGLCPRLRECSLDSVALSTLPRVCASLRAHSPLLESLTLKVRGRHRPTATTVDAAPTEVKQARLGFLEGFPLLRWLNMELTLPDRWAYEAESEYGPDAGSGEDEPVVEKLNPRMLPFFLPVLPLAGALTELTVTNAREIDNAALALIFDRCQRLSGLTLTHCPRLTRLMGCSRSLRTLMLNNIDLRCGPEGPEELEALDVEALAPNLEELGMIGGRAEIVKIGPSSHLADLVVERCLVQDIIVTGAPSLTRLEVCPTEREGRLLLELVDCPALKQMEVTIYNHLLVGDQCHCPALETLILRSESEEWMLDDHMSRLLGASPRLKLVKYVASSAPPAWFKNTLVKHPNTPKLIMDDIDHLQQE